MVYLFFGKNFCVQIENNHNPDDDKSKKEIFSFQSFTLFSLEISLKWFKK